MAKEQLSPESTLKVNRILQAPRERVFRAWTDPKELARWFAPSTEYSTKVPELDLRVGGKYIVEMHHKDGNVHIIGGTYKEIRPPERIVFTWSWEGDPSSSESLVTLEFLDLGPSTEILLTHEQLPSAEQRQKHEQGWNGCLAQLAAYVSSK